MKRILSLAITLLAQTAYAGQITVCTDIFPQGKSLACQYDYASNGREGTNLQTMYKNGWKLVAVEVFKNELQRRTEFYFYLEK